MRFSVSHDSKPTADNKQEKDTPHYICRVVASSRLPRAMDATQISICGNRDDFFLVDSLGATGAMRILSEMEFDV